MNGEPVAGPAPTVDGVRRGRHPSVIPAEAGTPIPDIGSLDVLGALRSGAIRLHYQPEFDLRTREVIAVEALARWDHPSLGPVAPQSFIAAAELSGDIDEIGRWVLSSACAQRAKWAGDLGGRPLDLRVNVSPVQLSDPNLPQDVAQVLRDTGMRPDELFLEITEGSEPTDALALIDAVDRLRGMGVRIAIDDFGVGRNGLLRLREMPVDLLKIDRAFVVGLRRGSRDSAIVEAVIGLARSLKIEVVAEGVQAPEAVTELLRLGCQRGQGYLLGPPMAADEIAAVIATPGNS